MTSSRRIWFPGAAYHITIRGNRRNDIFRDIEDFQVYLTLIQGAFEYYDNKYKIACYCLMDNHVHILLQTTDRHLSDFVTRINSIYVRFFNNKYNYIGHLYQDRYYSELIETDSHMLDTSRYIHLNPVKAKMVEKAENYTWSSYAAYLGSREDKVIDKKIILSYFKDKSIDLYKKFIEEGINKKLDCEEDISYGCSS
ncbi:MAG TPA: transposase [Clostridiaceae bacterium]